MAAGSSLRNFSACAPCGQPRAATPQWSSRRWPRASPIEPRVTRTVVLSGIVALMLAFGAVVLAQGADRRIRDPFDLEELTDRPMLSAIPRSAFNDERLGGAEEEAFQTLRAGLTYFNVDRPVTSVLVTSPVQGDGKTTVATNLARAMARAGKDVVLVDADLRRPQVASRLHIPGTAGLGAVLVDEASLSEALIEPEIDATQGGRLRVLPAGPPPPNPSELLGSQRMKDLLVELTDMSELVIIDSTPLLTVSDSLPLIEVVSGVVDGRTPERDLEGRRPAAGERRRHGQRYVARLGGYGRQHRGPLRALRLWGLRLSGSGTPTKSGARSGNGPSSKKSRRARAGRRKQQRGAAREEYDLPEPDTRPAETTSARGRGEWFS